MEMHAGDLHHRSFQETEPGWRRLILLHLPGELHWSICGFVLEHTLSPAEHGQETSSCPAGAPSALRVGRHAQGGGIPWQEGVGDGRAPRVQVGRLGFKPGGGRGKWSLGRKEREVVVGEKAGVLGLVNAREGTSQPKRQEHRRVRERRRCMAVWLVDTISLWPTSVRFRSTSCSSSWPFSFAEVECVLLSTCPRPWEPLRISTEPELLWS